MNRFGKKYISEIKTFFPFFCKTEKDYLKKLRANVYDFCAENNVSTMEELYHQYGLPIDIVRTYYSFIGIDGIIKRFKTIKQIISFAIVIVVILLVMFFIAYKM